MTTLSIVWSLQVPRRALHRHVEAGISVTTITLTEEKGETCE